MLASKGIHASGLTRAFGDLVAVDSLDLRVDPASVVGLLGPNGAGKTTALRMLATLLRPTGVRASVAGFDVQLEALKVSASVGYLTGDTGLYGRLTPIEVLRYFGQLHAMSEDAIAARSEALVDRLGIGSFRGRRCEALSTGQRQRVSIARAFLHDPPVLILDEPTSGLDILAAREILQLFREEADRGKTVLLSTHILEEVELLCDRATIIHQGCERAAGTLAELAELGRAPTLGQGFFNLLGEGAA